MGQLSQSAAVPKPTPVQTWEEACQLPDYRQQARVRASQSGDFVYDKPARQIVTLFRLSPPSLHGRQKFVSQDFYFAPNPHTRSAHADPWGNNIVETRHETVEKHLTFVVEMACENTAAYDAQGRLLPCGIPANRTAKMLETSPLTNPDDDLREVAWDLKTSLAHAGDELALFHALGTLVNREMTFQSGITGTRTTATEAWAMRRGVCQDYTHILLTLLRLSDIPARYVSGFVPAEGAMHAWVEAALAKPGESARSWYAFDATHNRWVTERYLTVATGRDYFDIMPTSGTYFGGKSVLSHKSRAMVESTTRLEGE